MKKNQFSNIAFLTFGIALVSGGFKAADLKPDQVEFFETKILAVQGNNKHN